MRISTLRSVIRTVEFLTVISLVCEPSLSRGAFPDIHNDTPQVAPLPEPAPPTPPSAMPTQDAWRQTMAKKPAPKGGCYTSTYPSTDWQEVPCATDLPLLPHAIPDVGGGGPKTGYLESVSLPITSVRGSFYSVTGVTNECNQANSATTACNATQPPSSPNTFSLQLNPNMFPTPLCPANTPCIGAQQYIYDNDGAGKNSSLYIQYWLLNYPSTTPCPQGFRR